MKIFSIWIWQQSTNLCFNGVAEKIPKRRQFYGTGMEMGNRTWNEMSTDWKWNGSKMVVEWKWNSNGKVTDNITVKREFYKQIFQQSTNM
jgi:hypothetical protein